MLSDRNVLGRERRLSQLSCLSLFLIARCLTKCWRRGRDVYDSNSDGRPDVGAFRGAALRDFPSWRESAALLRLLGDEFNEKAVPLSNMLDTNYSYTNKEPPINRSIGINTKELLVRGQH
ncbi:uncharacterized protein F5Z01DRAFT_211998 [Emericellopsis atlantica]|uniref:Uncharacterized protein n=1 Tax=Emericellopsis atlantica TaxID=2614577 RepID=A0A9P8CTC2_9HYPO|nr:uncharacterized protein F5Z01DRAFT_211998 [Emericellopsis atlantica]KAG9258688.1 hypothetical protein F5Z01DRAFT_211998 [Emericellopsis atlantica]